MRCSGWFAFSVLAATVLAVAVGCGGDKDKDKDKTPVDKKENGGEPKTTGDLKPVEIKGRGTLKGMVTGDVKPAELEALTKSFVKTLNEAKENKEHCLKQEGENVQQTWIMDDKGGLANVIVWVAPPEGH